MGVLLSMVLSLAGQEGPRAVIRVDVRTSNAPVASADVVVAGRTYRTGAGGTVSIDVAPGDVTITVVKEDMVPVTTTVTVQAGQLQVVLVDLERRPTVEEHVTVSATRTD